MNGIEPTPVVEHFDVTLDDWWVCVCGNDPRSTGLYPVNADGCQVEPTPADWPDDLIACGDCGRVGRATDRDETTGLVPVIGRAPVPLVLADA